MTKHTKVTLLKGTGVILMMIIIAVAFYYFVPNSTDGKVIAQNNFLGRLAKMKDDIVMIMEMGVITVIFLTFMSAIAVFVMWQNGYLRTLFTTVGSTHILFVNKGESHWKTYINSPGEVLVNGRIIKERYPDESEKSKTIIERELGLYWVGPKWLNRNVKTFPITRQKEKEKITPEDQPDDWIETMSTLPNETELREFFPRPVLVPVKFQGNIDVMIYVLPNFKVVEPFKPIYKLQGDFFVSLVSAIRSGVAKYCQTITYDQFQIADRTDDGEMSKTVTAAVCPQMTENTGITALSLAAPRWKTITTAEEDAEQAKEIARLKGEGVKAAAEADAVAAITMANAAAETSRIKAEQDANNLVILANKQKEADEILALASVIDYTTMLVKAIENKVDPNVASQNAAIVAEATRFSDPKSKVTILSKGPTSLALPTGK